LMKKVRSKWSVVLGTIFFYIFVLFLFEYFLHSKNDRSFTAILYGYWITTQFECLAIGAAFTLIVTSKNRTMELMKKILFNQWLQWLVLISTIYCIAIGFHFYYLNVAAYSCLFGCIITNLAVNPKRIINLEWKPLHYLGKISYGIYMYHLLIITISLKALMLLHLPSHVLLYPISFLLTIIIAAISYKYFETPFLKKKARYTRIHTDPVTA